MYQEEKTFNLRFQLEAQFPEEYNGEEDAHAWENDWETRIKPEIIKAVFNALRNAPSWSAHIRNRGMSALDEVEIAMTKVFGDDQTLNGS
ncbi:hypothetical protein [Candidatus Nitronereus thalassa]|uniref:Uncharacterized protein n=1 Tax=Candidatus Nitronereus thalassa TaxID=3020898 RepID=A0ABU3K6Z0_9BACT|nr:hypothetical protein [Candidatus Nitronereus thalassa]MDT7042141.1 hypothetical protein [Candidatus Nitronereus thalassa]